MPTLLFGGCLYLRSHIKEVPVATYLGPVWIEEVTVHAPWILGVKTGARRFVTVSKVC